MSSLNRSFTPILGTAFIAVCLASGTATAQEAGDGMATDQQARHHSMADMDTDHDGRLSRSEFAAAHGGKTDEFAAHDANGDGFISQVEMDAHHAAMKAEHEAAHTVQQDKGKPTL